jgi:hypothetical protein
MKNIKGVSKIELFDGITGKKTNEYVNDNIVTNALQNILNISTEQFVSGFQVNTYIDNVTPQYPIYLRGIQLWDRNIPENPNLIYPPSGTRCVGHAGSVYSGIKATRGTLNINETEVLENGVRMVWDFGTDKANGTIRAASLTSILGGNAGWMTPFETGIAQPAERGLVMSRPSNNISSTVPSQITFNPTSLMTTGTFSSTGELRRGIYTFIAAEGNNLVILEKRYTNPESIGIFDKCCNSSSAHAPEATFTVTSNAPFINLATNFTIENNTNFVHVAVSGGSGVHDHRTARIRTINLITKTLVSDRTITLREDISNNPAAFYKNQIIARRSGGTETCLFNENGEFVLSLMTNPSAGTMRRHHIHGDTIVGGIAGTSFFISDGVNSQQYPATGTAGTIPLLDAGNATAITLAGGTMAPIFVNENNHGYILTPYMATINNLAGQVVKTNLNTMKVTYELTQL